MKRLLVLPLLFITSVAYAQQARPTDKFAWQMDQVGAELATVQGFRYDLELDNTLQPVPLTTTCTGVTPPFDCQAPIPPMNNGSHTVRVRAVDLTVPNEPYVGDWSDLLTFSMTGKPPKPSNLRIVR